MRAAAVAALALACAPGVRLVGDYDPVTDAAVMGLAQSFDSLLITLDGLPRPQCEYESHAGFYSGALARVHALETRNAARDRNAETAAQLFQLDSAALDLRALHRAACLTPGQIAVSRAQLDVIFRAILTLELAKKGRG